MTDEERITLETSKRYEELYNEDVVRFGREVYTSDCVVYCMGGPTIHGADALIGAEQKILAAAPQRRMRIDHRHVIGSVVVIEAVIVDPDKGTDWELPFSAVLKLRDGKIAVDRSYAEWPRWPGL